MRRNAKASSIASMTARGSRLGSFLRTPSGPRPRVVLALAASLAAALVTVLGVLPAFADTAPGVSFPLPESGGVSSVTESSAHLKGEVNPRGGPSETEWTFQYATSESGPWTNVSGGSGAVPGSDSLWHQVEADLTGLSSGTRYYARLVATNESGAKETISLVRSFETLGPPTASTAPIYTPIGNAWRLYGSLNPHGVDTHYYFEYGPDTGYGHTAPAPPADGGAGVKDVAVHSDITGLEPGREYHFRLVAESSKGTALGNDQSFVVPNPGEAAASSCGNEAFRTGPSTQLSDCRAYEQVSPANKAGGQVNYQTFLGALNPTPWQASIDGDGVTFTSTASFAGAENAVPVNPYLASRQASGWTTRSLGWPMNASGVEATAEAYFNGYRAFSPQLDSGVLSDVSPTGPALAAGAPLGYPNLYLRNLVTNAYTTLTSAAPSNYPPQTTVSQDLPVFQGASSDLTHVLFYSPSVLTPDALEPSCNSCNNLYVSSGGNLHLVNVLPDGSPTTDAGAGGRHYFNTYVNGFLTHAISADGSKIYWTDTSIQSHGNIYLRIDAARTVPVGYGQFQAATPSGDQAIYIGKTAIKSRGDLYRFDLVSESSTDLLPGGEVTGVVGASEDLSYIYFVSTAALAPGAPEGDSITHRNLYLWHDGHVSLISPDPGIYIADPRVTEVHDSYVTPNGHYALFGTSTGQANLYDAQTGQLSCVSCTADGSEAGGQVAVWQTVTYAPHSVSDNGDSVVFQTSEALLPGDTNEQLDVYQWEPGGTAYCGKAAGCLHLVSGGSGGVANPGVSTPVNYFVDQSPSGSDIFFTTGEGLVPSDVDDTSDLYDARVDGGIAAQFATATACSGDGCRGESTSRPGRPNAASADMNGRGNLQTRRSCRAPARRARRLSLSARRLHRRAGQLLRRAHREPNGRRTSSLNRHGRRLAKRARLQARRAQRLARQTKRCRRANRRAGK